MTRRATSVSAIIAVLLLAATACGVPEDSNPRVLAADELPGLAPGAADPEPSAAPNDPATTAIVQLYFLDEDGLLQPVERDTSSPVDPRLVIEALIAGLTEDEREALSTSIPNTEQVLGDTSVADGILNLELLEDQQGGIFDLERPEQKNAIAQIVWTATDLPAISGVRIRIGEEFRSLPTDSEDSIDIVAVTRDDYRSYDPEAQPAEEPVGDG